MQDSLIPSGSSPLTKSNIVGGPTEQVLEREMLDGGLITSSLQRNLRKKYQMLLSMIKCMDLIIALLE